MMRSRVALLVLGVVCALSTVAEAAVDVVVNKATKLYDAQGRVIQEVKVGYPFEADRARGKWVYGFLKTKGGGRRGFIALDDLHMSDDDRRALNIPITTGKSAEPVLLRYTLRPGETQVYHTEVVTNGSIGLGQGRITQHLALKSSIQLGFSVLGTAEADGAYNAELRYHKLRLAMEFARGTGRKVRIEANESKVTSFLDGQPTYSGKWDDYPGAEGPNFAKLVRTTARIKISNRHELLDIGELGDMLQTGMIGGVSGIVDVAYPEQAVRGGDSWQGSSEQLIGSPLGSGEQIRIPSTTTFTVLERTEYMKRPCVKLLVETSEGASDQTAGLAMRCTTIGIVYIDEEHGIPLNADLTGALEMAGRQGQIVIQGKLNLTVSSRYAGTEIK
jgi:hypothetical protein